MGKTRQNYISGLWRTGLSVIFATGVVFSAVAADKVKVGIFVASSALPYYVGVERGYFADADIDVQPVFVGAHPLVVQALASGEIDAASNLVTLEGAQINAQRPGTLKYIALNGQNSEYVMDQFVVKPDSDASNIADLEGANLFSAPGPANFGVAKAILIASGLEEGAFSIQEQGMGNHAEAMKSGKFDGGYTLEAVASIMVNRGITKRLETGVIAKYLMGDETAEAYAAGAAISGEMLRLRPKVAERFSQAWAKAVNTTNEDASARALLTQMGIPAALTKSLPLSNFTMVSDLTESEIAEFQTFIDIGVDLGVVADEVSVADMIAAM